MKDPGLSAISDLTRALEERTREAEALRDQLRQKQEQLERLTDERNKNAKLYDNLLESNPSLICTHDLNGILITVNSATLALLDRPMEEVIGKSLSDVLSPSVKHLFPEYLERIRKFSRDAGMMRVSRKNGEDRVLIYQNLMIKEEGQKPYVLGNAQDITDLIRAQRALRASEERYRVIFESNPFPMWVYETSTGRILATNHAAIRKYGYSREEFLDLTIFDIRPPQDVEPLRRYLEEFGDFPNVQDVWRHRTKDGTTLDVEVRAHPVLFEGKKARMVLAYDVTERKKAEERLVKQKKYFALLHDTAINLISRLDLNDVLETIVLRMCEITNLPNGYLYVLDSETNEMRIRVGLGFASGYLGLDVKPGLGVAGKVWQTGEPVLVEDYSKWPDRLDHPHLHALKTVIGVPLKSGTKVIGILGVETVHEPHSFSREEIEFLQAFAQLASLAIDNARLYTASQNELVERIHAEDALRRSEEKFRLLFEESKDVFFISSPDGKFTDINPAGVALFGYSSKEEMMAIHIDNDLFNDPANRRNYQRLMKEQGYVKDFELQLRRKDGVLLTVLETATAVQDANGNLVAYRGIMRDVTQLKYLQQQILQWQKIETIGQLAGGVAHDFNNLLMAISGHCEVLEMKIPVQDPILNDLSEIKKAADAGASLTKQLLAFSRKQVLEPKVLNLNRVLTGMKNMLQRLIGEGVSLEFEFEQNLGLVKVDPNQFEQVILNLSVNARDAMPEGGKLLIQTSNASLRDGFFDPIDSGSTGDYVLVRVSDTGCGMDPETMSHIFEPFFTTKPEGHGTGLGLPTVYGVIHQSGGRIFVDSLVGSGTVFEIYLPGVDVQEEDVQPPPVMPDVGSKQINILLVDDNQSILQAVGTFLSMQNYKVTSAHSPVLALELSQKMDRIELLITDVVMPNMTGPQLANAIRGTHPNVKVLFLSGYSDEAVRKEGILNQDAIFLQKPASMQDLVKKINLLLG